MKTVLFLILFLPALGSAQRTLSPQAFQSHIRPPLNAILNDFYQMISLYPDFPREIVTLVSSLETLSNDKESLLSICPRNLNKQCLSQIDALREKLLKLQEKSFPLLSKQKASHSLYLNNLGGLRLLSEFQNELNQIKGELDNSSFLIRAQLQDKRSTFTLIRKLDQMKTLLSLAIIEFIPFTYREDMKKFLFNFVHPVELHISKNKNYEFLNRNVKSLNFSLNLMVQNLTKRNKKTPEGMSPYLSLIHNRWNNILRYYY